jgi:molybdopterin converting factor small subunit
MNVRVLIPSPLRPHVGNRDVVLLEGRTVGELLTALTRQYPLLRHHLFTDDGTLRSFVNVYVNDDDIRYRENMRTMVRESDVVSIIPSIAGGTQ